MRARFIVTPPERGALNMALDAAIARAGVCEIPTLRIFSWRPFCISLGHHQQPAVIDLGACEDAGIDVARRPTGGGAIFHAQEVTYSFCVPAAHPWYRLLPLDLYRRINEALASGLTRLGAAVAFAPGQDAARSGRASLYAACFASSARNEILVHGRKLVGSAQRRFREGTLQHGCILLGLQHHLLTDFLAGGATDVDLEKSRLAGGTTTLFEVCGRAVAEHEVRTALLEGFAATCGIHFEDGHLHQEEDDLAAAWRERYQIFMPKTEASLCASVCS